MSTKSHVYFVPIHTNKGTSHLLERVHEANILCGIKDVIKAGDLTAVKMHFGEYGLTTYLSPAFVRSTVEQIVSLGAKPFLTDTNTLYRARRHNAVDHLVTALKNGFSFGSVGAPVIIADGLHGHSFTETPLQGAKHFASVPIPDAIHDADSMVMMSHFTAHLVAGFGATIKNLSMGCSNPQGKRRMHCHSKPSVDKSLCIACGECAEHCPTKAIEVNDYAVIDQDVCMACGECTVICPQEAIRIPWDENSSILQEKMAEYARAVVQQKQNRIVFQNYLVNITPHCDCMSISEIPFHPDLGVLVSRDPVAADQAGIDFINGKIVWNGSVVTDGTHVTDPLREIYPKIDWSVQLSYAEEIGLGSKAYELTVVV